MNAYLTTLENEALQALLSESEGTGHDFGVLEDVEWSDNRQSLGGLVTSLREKGVIADFDSVNVPTDDGKSEQTIHQYRIADEFLPEL